MDFKTALSSSVSFFHTENVDLYEHHHAFVPRLGVELLELLAPQNGEKILDLGCGTGHLTYQITTRGAEVLGIDSAPAMIKKAHDNYPELRFEVGNGIHLSSQEQFDAVFSNAVLHWITPPEEVIANIWQVLKPGGRFVAEFGGKGNIQAVITAIYQGLEVTGCRSVPANPWYFPSIGEYSQLLEQQGFEVKYAMLMDRPTPLSDGVNGLRNWLKMFAGHFFEGISNRQKNQVLQAVEEILRPSLYHNGIWIADYRRIRIVAGKPASTSRCLG